MSDSANALLAHLQAEISAFNQFFETLKAEQAALIANNVATLAELSQIKLNQVEALNRLAAERLRHLMACGLSASDSGMEQWLKTTSDAGRKAWKDLLAVASEASTCNQINGKLILQSMQHHQQAMAVLLAAANQVSLYGRDGQPQGAFPGIGVRGIIGSA